MTNNTNSSLTIIESLLLIVGLIIIYGITKYIFSTIAPTSISELFAGIIRLLLFYSLIRIMIKKDWAEKEQFLIKRISGSILLLACIMIHLTLFLPFPKLSLFGEPSTSTIINLVTNTTIYNSLNLCIITPIFEELLFRGIILGGLLKRYPPTIALITSSLLFGLFHLDFIGSTIVGSILGWIYYRTQNLSYCILIHFSINLTGTILRYTLKYTNVENFISSLTQIPYLNIWMGTVSSILFIICFLSLNSILNKKVKKEHE